MLQKQVPTVGFWVMVSGRRCYLISNRHNIGNNLPGLNNEEGRCLAGSRLSLWQSFKIDGFHV